MYIEKGFTAHWREGMSSEAYHADRSAISSTPLRDYMSPEKASPRKFLTQYLEGQSSPPTKDMIFGSNFHSYVYENEAFRRDHVEVPDFEELYGNYRKKEHQEGKKQWFLDNADKIVVGRGDLEKFKGMYESLMEHPDASVLLSAPGMVERVGYFCDEKTYLKCRMRIDQFNPVSGFLGDLKTTRDCTKEAFQKSIWNHRYDMQLAMYSAGVEQITGIRPLPVLIAVEKEPPYECAVYYFMEEDLKRARADYRSALDRVDECLTEGTWPRYQRAMQAISIPHWALNR